MRVPGCLSIPAIVARNAGLTVADLESLRVQMKQAGIACDDDRSSLGERGLERGDDFTLFRSFHS